MKYFKVKFGYGSDDFISIDETELSKALRAQINGTVAIFKEGSIAGRNIMIITPDVNRMMGWNRTFQPGPENYGEMTSGERKQIKACAELLETTTLQISGRLPEGDVKNLPPSKYSKELANKFSQK